MKPVTRCLLPVLLVGAALISAPAAGMAAVGPEPPPGGGEDKLQVPKGWTKCPTCSTLHPEGVPCPKCPPKGFEKCKDPKCGAFFPAGRECPNCTRRVPRRAAACPVCKKRFEGPMPHDRNGKVGTDRDFCRHSLGRDVVEALVWTCTRCGHTDWCPEVRGEKETPAEFNEPVGEDYAAAVRKKAQPLVEKLLTAELSRVSARMSRLSEELDQLEVPDRIKYELALECAGLRGEDAAVLAKLALEGSYACRRELIGPIDHPMLNQIIPAIERELQKRGAADEDARTVVKVTADMIKESDEAERNKKPPTLAPLDKYYVYVRLAGCWDRLGDPRLARHSLEEARKAIEVVKGNDDFLKPLLAIVRHRTDLIEKECWFRARAIGELRKAILEDNAYPGSLVIPTLYQLGELNRRQSEFGKARAWLTLSAKLAGENHPLSHLVAEVMQLESMSGADPDSKEEAAAVDLAARLTGKDPGELIGPKTPDDGGSPIGPPVGRPKTCRQCLANIHKAYAAYVRKNNRPPRELGLLVEEGMITAEAAADFKCPESGLELRYRPPKKLDSPDELMIWRPRKDGRPMLLLYSDGRVEERK